MKELSILLMGMSLIFMFVIAVVLVLYILAYWMIFRKAGEAGWKALLSLITSDAADERSSVDLGGRRII